MILFHLEANWEAGEPKISKMFWQHSPSFHHCFFVPQRYCTWSSPSCSSSGHAFCPSGSGSCWASSTPRCPCPPKPSATSTTWPRAWHIQTAALTLSSTHFWPRTTRSTWGSTSCPGQQAATSIRGIAFSARRAARRLPAASSAPRALCLHTHRPCKHTPVCEAGALVSAKVHDNLFYTAMSQ